MIVEFMTAIRAATIAVACSAIAATPTDQRGAMAAGAPRLAGGPGAVSRAFMPTETDTATDSVDLSVVGHFGGEATAIDISDGVAYVGIGHRLHVIDVEDAARPIVIAASGVLAGRVRDVDVVHPFAYAATESGLTVIDVSSPSAPTLAGQLNTVTGADRVEVVDGYAYLVTGYYDFRDVIIVDIRSPRAPRAVGDFGEVGSHARDVFAHGMYAYVAAGAGSSSSMHVLDISLPVEPRLVGSVATRTVAHAVHVTGDWAYVAVSDGLLIFDVSESSAPRLIGSYDHVSLGSARQAVFVAGDLAFIRLWWGRLYVLDVSDPRSPTYVGGALLAESAGDLVVVDGHAFLAAHGLQVVDATQPASLRTIAQLDLAAEAWGVAVRNTIAYVAAGTDGLLVMDVADPSDLHVTGQVTATVPGDDAFFVSDVKLAGEFACVAAGLSGLWVVDVSDATSPNLVGVAPMHDTRESAQAIAVRWPHAYVSTQDGGLFVYDLESPHSPLAIARAQLHGWAKSIEIVGSHLLLAGEGYFDVVDVADPTAPRRIDANFPVDAAADVQVIGWLAFVAEQWLGLSVLEVDNPASPTEIGRFALADDTEASAVGVSRNLVYLAHSAGLVLVDVWNPLSPAELGRFSLAWSPSGVEVVGNVAMVAAGDSGLLMIRAAAPPSVGVAHLPAAYRRQRMPGGH